MAPLSVSFSPIEGNPITSKVVHYAYRLWMESMDDENVEDGYEYPFEISTQEERTKFETEIATILDSAIRGTVDLISFTYQVDYDEKRLYLSLVLEETEPTEALYESISETSISNMSRGFDFRGDFRVQGVHVVPNWSPL